MRGRDSGKDQTLLDTEFSPAELQLVDLWKHFEGVGDNAKSQMAGLVNWMLTFAGGLISYIVGYTFIQQLPNEAARWCLKDAQIAYAAGTLGVCVCLLTLIMIWEFRAHTYRNWWRATRCKNEVRRLHLLVTDTTRIEPLGKPDEFRPQGRRVALVFWLYTIVTAAFLVLLAGAILMHGLPRLSPLELC
jgi:hypothetical protein